MPSVLIYTVGLGSVFLYIHIHLNTRHTLFSYNIINFGLENSLFLSFVPMFFQIKFLVFDKLSKYLGIRLVNPVLFRRGILSRDYYVGTWPLQATLVAIKNW